MNPVPVLLYLAGLDLVVDDVGVVAFFSQLFYLDGRVPCLTCYAADLFLYYLEVLAFDRLIVFPLPIYVILSIF